MQERNDSGDVLRSVSGPAADIARLTAEKTIKLEAKTHIVVAPLPKVGEEFELNGLRYKVYYVHPNKGKFHAKLVKEENGDGK